MKYCKYTYIQKRFETNWGWGIGGGGGGKEQGDDDSLKPHVLGTTQVNFKRHILSITS